LSAKNAILIVEVAREERMLHGRDIVQAAVDAARARFRPIIMTSFAFILGVLPLALNTGAGSASQNAIGTGVIGGMAAAVILGIFFVPILFVIVRHIFKAKPDRHHPETSAAGDAEAKH
jgi:multidrug efflux pump